jgi:hypothetical protein
MSPIWVSYIETKDVSEGPKRFCSSSWQVIAGKKIPTKNHLILSVDLFELNPKQTRSKKLLQKRDGSLSLPPTDSPERKEEREPLDDNDIGNSGEEQRIFLCHILSTAMHSNFIERYLNRESGENVFCTINMHKSLPQKNMSIS